jgi:hypothetical protein
MSLINDALKRARDAERRRAATPPDLTLHPVDPPSHGNPASRWLVLVLVLIALTLSLWSFSRWAKTAPPEEQLASAPQSTPPTPSPHVLSVLPEPEPDSDTAPETVAPPLIATSTNNLDLGPTASPEPAAVPEQPALETAVTDTNETLVSPPVPAELKLQSIIFRLRNPSVVINGQMLRTGDSIADAQVLEIERHRVTLRRHDSNLVLTLPSY